MRGAEPDPEGQLTDAELDVLLAPFAGTRLIALAVSGGPDSLGLLAAVDRWRRRGRRPEVLVLSVDHRLRRGSGAEAKQVAAIAAARGMGSRVLVRPGPRPVADVEAAARRARYGLLVGAARTAGASHLLTAHHRDDQAETLLLRLQRGAGVFGLAAMRPLIALGDVMLARPFLSVPRARLAATAAAAGLVAVDDPMNDDPRFARTRVRRLLPLLAAEGLRPVGLAAAALRLADAATAIDAAASAVLISAVAVDPYAIAWLDPAAFAAAPREVRLRVLARLLVAVGGEDYPPRFERLAALRAAVEAYAGGRFKRTLAGTVVEARRGRLAFYREIGRDGLTTLKLAPGFTAIWDHRFAVSAGKSLSSGLTLGALGEHGRLATGLGGEIAPAAAVAALPAVWRGARIVAVPALGYFARGGNASDLTVRPILEERLAAPPLFPDFGPNG